MNPETSAQKPPPDGSLIHQPASWIERLRLAEMFAQTQPLEVELGAGDGSFLAQWAAAHPERNFIGVAALHLDLAWDGSVASLQAAAARAIAAG